MPSVRDAGAGDLLAVEVVCLDAFREGVASRLSRRGVATFSAVASASAFEARMTSGNEVLVAEQDGAIVGVAELRDGRHVAMLFVAPQGQRRGVGRTLLAALVARARAPRLTVSASLGSVDAYRRFGFHCCGPIAESAGLVYQPMECVLEV